MLKNSRKGGLKITNKTIKVGVGWSIAKDSFKAGAEAAQIALKNFSSTPEFAAVFATVDYNLKKLLAGIKSKTGNIKLYGGTSFNGVIVPDGYKTSKNGSVSIILFSSPHIKFGVGVANISKDARKSGQKAVLSAVKNAGKKISQIPQSVMMLAAPGMEEEIILGIQDVFGRVPVTGGSSGDNTIQGKWKQFANFSIYSNAVVIAAIYSRLKIGTGYGSGFIPTDKRAIVTESKGRKLIELDGKKAASVYSAWTGKPMQKIQGNKILAESITSPIAVLNSSGKLYLVKHPAAVNKDSSISLFAEIKQGTSVTLMKASKKDLINAVGSVVKEAVKDANSEPAALILVHCGGRTAILGEKGMEEVVKKIKNVIGNTPFIGYCTFGEQGFIKWTENCHCDLLLSALIIGNEKD